MTAMGTDCVLRWVVLCKCIGCGMGVDIIQLFMEAHILIRTEYLPMYICYVPNPVQIYSRNLCSPHV